MNFTSDVAGRSDADRHAAPRIDQLGRYLTAAIILFSSVVTTVITAIQLYTDYRNDIGRIEENFKFVRESYLNVLVDSVWTANDNQIRAQLEGLLRLRDMEYLAISVEGQPRWVAGAKRSRRLIEAQAPLERIYREKPVLIGRLELAASEDEVLARVANRLLMVLGENAVKTLLVAVFVLWLFRNKVTRHLDQLARFADGMRASSLTGPALQLARPVDGRWRPDELDAVVEAFNAMRGTLSDAYDDLRETADRLAQSEQRFRVLVSNVPGVIYRCDAKRPYLLQFISDGVSRLSGQALARFTGEHAIPWSELILPEDRERVDREIALAITDSRPYELEYRISHADGSPRWISDYGRPAGQQDSQPAWIDAVVVDITARKNAELALYQTERKLSLHVRQSIMGIIEWNTDFRVVEWNPAAECIFGYTREEAIGRHAKEIILAPATIPIIDPVWTDLLSRIGGTYSNNDNVTRDGRVISCEWFNTPLTDSEGKIIGVMSLVRDITERKRAEAELQTYRDHLEDLVKIRTAELVAAKELAEGANRAKSVFLANMSHELRTPLNAILGFSALLRRDTGLAGREREHLDIINRSGEHLLGLINDILDMAKIEAGRVDLQIAPLDLHALVRDLAGMMRQRAQEKGLELHLEQSSRLVRHIKGDETRLRQVLVNLLGNAVKFTERGTVTLRLDAAPDPSGLRLSIEVEDTGPGIAPEDQARVFEPFEQTGSAKAQSKGTGLGLAITRQFVELMGGRIGVTGQLGRGSRFWIELPVEPAAAAEVTGARDEGGEVLGLAPGQPEWRMLIVEDQPENALLLGQLLEDVGFRVQVAEHGARGVELFRAWRPHLIWMDRRMPVLDGLEATRRIRALAGGGAVKIVALTASVFAEQRGEMLEAGMDDILHKPFRPEEIFGCLERRLGVRFLRREAEPAAPAPAPAPLDRASLAALPDDLRRELADALVALDIERIDALIERVAERHPALGQLLRRHADNFDFTLIEDALRGAV